MAVYTIKMPDIGEGIAEVELVEWHVKEGDAVVEDQVLADVMTEKATVQVPSPVNGTVLALGGSVGEIMAVGSDLIRLQIDGDGPAIDGDSDDATAAAGHTAPQAEKIEPQKASAKASGTPGAVAEVAPEAASEAARSAEPALPVAAGITASASASDQSHKSAAGPSARAAGGSGRPMASPAVRRRAQEEGIDLRFVPATGPVGQITHEDLDRYLQGGGSQLSGAAPGGGVAAMSLARREGVEEIPVIGLRRKIAQKMQQSKRQIPHFTYVEEIDVTELEALRAKLNERSGETRGRLTLLPFLARAMVLAVREFPQMNARYDEEKGVVLRHAPVHLGMATQTDAGLMVPVLRHAEAHDLWSFAGEVRRLAEAVRGGTAQRDELSGSTITLTSLGALGGIVSTPVINHPEVAIVGVNRVVERPVVLNGAIVVRKMMNLSSSFDHRVVDGMHAAQFVQSIRGYIECPSLLFVE